MSITINDIVFYEKPTSCGVCPFFDDGHSNMVHPEYGYCKLWDETHRTIINHQHDAKNYLTRLSAIQKAQNL
ncbi:MAG: hypothetical protein PHD21_08710 [Flavobacteriales bacterium]|nr:hypothetical protein [Flavobacteriales bacterium]